MQSNLFLLQDQALSSQAKLPVDLLALYKAMGEGW
jgi:outer membrane protein TolC